MDINLTFNSSFTNNSNLGSNGSTGQKQLGFLALDIIPSKEA